MYVRNPGAVCVAVPCMQLPPDSDSCFKLQPIWTAPEWSRADQWLGGIAAAPVHRCRPISMLRAAGARAHGW